jgi:hypothetical protein
MAFYVAPDAIRCSDLDPSRNTALAGEPAGRQSVRVDLGIQRLAYCMICGALLDFQGRLPSGKDPRPSRVTRLRQHAASAIKWLRDERSRDPLSLWWCTHVLGIPVRLVHDVGFASHVGICLANWRDVRAVRRKGHTPTQQMRRPLKQCNYCGVVYQPRHHGSEFCSQKCVGRALIARKKAKPPMSAQAVSRGKPTRYEQYAAFCAVVGVRPWSEAQWTTMQ